MARLPNPPDEYNRSWANQYSRVLEDVILQLQTKQMEVELPNYTTAQKEALTNRAGLMVYDTTLGKSCINTGSGWETISSS